MRRTAAITVNRPRDEVERRWRADHPEHAGDVTFTDAPGDRGTEIRLHVEKDVPGGRIVEKLVAAAPLAKAKDELRRFKQLVETGEIPRSEAVPEGERVERKLRQRPAQPLPESERREVGV